MPKHANCIIDPGTRPLWKARDGSRRVAPLIGPDSCGAQEISAGLWWLAPGHQSDLDFHPESAEIYYVVSGEGRLVMDGEEYTVRKGMTVYIPAGVEHQSFNTGNEDLCYYFAFSPPPKGPGKQEKQNWTRLR